MSILFLSTNKQEMIVLLGKAVELCITFFEREQRIPRKR
jgi:hypothetical protein